MTIFLRARVAKVTLRQLSSVGVDLEGLGKSLSQKMWPIGSIFQAWKKLPLPVVSDYRFQVDEKKEADTIVENEGRGKAKVDCSNVDTEFQSQIKNSRETTLSMLV